MIAFRTPVADCFVFYISRSPNEEVQVSHQGFPYPSTNGVAGPRSTIAKNLFGRYCCRTGRFRPAHSHGTRRKTDHTECAGQWRARALNPGLKRRDKRCRMGKQFRSIDLPPFQGVRNNLSSSFWTTGTFWIIHFNISKASAAAWLKAVVVVLLFARSLK